MLKLNLERDEEKIKVPQDIKDTFKEKLLIYLLPITGHSYYLNTFVVFDFQNEKAIYLKSATDENQEKFKNSEYGNEKGIPHGITPLSETSFLSFLLTFDPLNKSDKTFRKIDLLDNTMTIYSGKDLGCPDTMISDTCDRYKDGSFYLCFADSDMSYYYKMEANLKIQKLFEHKSSFLKPPHHVVRYKNLIFSTGFFEREFKIDNKVFTSDIAFKEYIEKQIKIEFEGQNIFTDYKSFRKSKGTFHDITENDDRYKYEVMPGKVLVYNMDTGKTQEVPVGCSPSHVVIDSEEEYAYILSNNITMVKPSEIFYLDPGRISKLKILSDKVEIVNEFIDPTGYRFTSHKLGRVNGKPYIITIGHPNKLFVVDGHTMKLEYAYNIKKDILGGISDIKKFLNDEYTQSPADPYRYSALETRGDYVVLMNQEEILFFCLKDRTIKYTVPYKMPDGFVQFTQHCDFT